MSRAIFRSNTRHCYGQCSKEGITIFLQQHDFINHEKHCVLSLNNSTEVLLLLYYTTLSLQVIVLLVFLEYIPYNLWWWQNWWNFYYFRFYVHKQHCWRLRYSGKCCAFSYRVSSSGSSSPRTEAMLDDWVFCTCMGDKGNNSTEVGKPIIVVLISSGQGLVYWLECL